MIEQDDLLDERAITGLEPSDLILHCQALCAPLREFIRLHGDKKEGIEIDRGVVHLRLKQDGALWATFAPPPVAALEAQILQQFAATALEKGTHASNKDAESYSMFHDFRLAVDHFIAMPIFEEIKARGGELAGTNEPEPAPVKPEAWGTW